MQDLHHPVWFAKRASLYWMSILTSIHFGQLNTDTEWNGDSIYLRLHLSILKTLLASPVSLFWWGGVLFATVLSHCLRHAAFARIIRDVNLNSARCFLAERRHSCLWCFTHMSRWSPRPSFYAVNVADTHTYVWMWVFVTLPPDDANVDFFCLGMRPSCYGKGHLIAGDAPSLSRPLQTA